MVRQRLGLAAWLHRGMDGELETAGEVVRLPAAQTTLQEQKDNEEMRMRQRRQV